MIICGKNKGIANSNEDEDGSSNNKIIKRSHSRMTVSLGFFIASLLLGVQLSYHTGRVLQQQAEGLAPDLLRIVKNAAAVLQPQDPENAVIGSAEKEEPRSPQEELLSAATYRRIVMKKAVSVCVEQECSEMVENENVMLEEITFTEAFGRYIEGSVEESDANEEERDNEEDSPHRTIHVIMDVERVDSAFLRDMNRVRQAIFNTVWEASDEHDIAIMSVHCQKTKFGGIICAAILEGGNHMTVLSDPDGKLCSLDMCMVTTGHLLDVVPIIEKHFGVGNKPLMRFRQSLRGPHHYNGRRWETLENDITEHLLECKNNFFFKKEIGSLTSDFQQIDVWEGLNPKLQSVDGYERSLQGSDGAHDYYTKHPELFHPNRQLYMDGVMQSSTIGDEAYHEGLVHPAMFAHAEGPKRVVIIGGGEGATLREILKHKSVEVCTMIEIDPGIVEASRAWLPSMNDCSDFGTGNCFDEPRTELRLEDAFGFFLNRFKREEQGIVSEEMRTDPYDVIVMDALDPDDTIEFAVQMYQDTVFWKTLHEALTENGILVVQLGMTPLTRAYGEQFGLFKNRANLFRSIEGAGFEQMFIYHDTHSDFKFPWSYMVACKSADCAKEWHRSEAQMNLRIHERILPSKSGKPILKHFDGATMQSYLRPYKSWETAHCRKVPMSQECSLYEATQQAVSWKDAFDVQSTEKTEDNILLVTKMNLTAGTIIYDTGSISTPSATTCSLLIQKDNATNQFVSVDADVDVYSRPTCGLTRKLSGLDVSGGISPLRDRQSHLFEMKVVIEDGRKGEQLMC